MKIYGDIDLLNLGSMLRASIAQESGDALPTDNVTVGRLVFVNQKLYIAVDVQVGSPVWVQLTDEINTYVYTQSSAATTWNITHDLNETTPVVQVYDNTGAQILPYSIVIIDSNNVQVNFTSASTGSAIIVSSGDSTQHVGNTYTLTGDVTGSGSSTIATTLATVNSNIGTFGDSTHVSSITVNGKGLVTGASNTAISFPVSSVFGRTGAVALQASDVTGALTYTPVNKAGDSLTGTLTFDGTHTVTGLPTPSNSADAVNKSYVDATTSNLTIHTAVKYATTSNLSATYSNGTSGVGATLTESTNGALSIDGQSPSTGDRILVKNQTAQAQNGIYSVTSVGGSSATWVLTRTSDADNSVAGEMAPGYYVFVSSGTVNGSTGWTETGIGSGTNQAIVIGTDNIVFTQFSSSATYTAGTGLSLSGSTFSNTGVISLSTSGSYSSALTLSGSTGAVTITPNLYSTVASTPGVVPGSNGVGSTYYLNAAGSWSVPANPSSANPSASIGLSAVNGTATTFMSSDSAPALSQSITPTWTGAHTFTPSSSVNALTVNGAASHNAVTINGSSTSGSSFGLGITAGTTSGDYAIAVSGKSNGANYFHINGDGSFSIGYANGNASVVGNSSGNISISNPTSASGATLTAYASAYIQATNIGITCPAFYIPQACMLGLQLNNHSQGSVQYFKIAQLPASAISTADGLTIKAHLNDSYLATSSTYWEGHFGNRNVFTYAHRYMGPATTYSKIVCYQESSGITTIYAALGTTYSIATIDITCGTVSDNYTTGITLYPSPTVTTSPTGTLVFDSSATTTYKPTSIASNSNFTVGYAPVPITDNSLTLGSSSLRWSTVYAATSTISTSDERLKTDITTSALGLDFINSLNPVSYKWIAGKNVDNADGTTTAQPGVRTHYGLLAQEVKAAVDAATPGQDFAGWILTDKNDSNSMQGLRYEELIAPLIKAIQELSAEVKALKSAASSSS